MAPKPSGDKRINPIKLRQMEDRCHAIEEEVARVEAEIADCERELANFRSAEETMRVSDLLTARREELENLLAEWEEVSHAIEASR